jgi:Domain of unknown function (DUF4091)
MSQKTPRPGMNSKANSENLLKQVKENIRQGLQSVSLDLGYQPRNSFRGGQTTKPSINLEVKVVGMRLIRLIFKSLSNPWICVPLLLLTTVVLTHLPANSAALSVWTAPSTSRIGLNDNPLTPQSPKLSAAKGETESFQIGIQSKTGSLTNVQVTVSHLFSANKTPISNQSIDLFREHYIYIDKPSPIPKSALNPSLGVGWYADGLIPFRSDGGIDPSASLKASPFTVEPGKNQAIWVDVNVPRTAAPGDYQGTYTITSDQGNFAAKFSVKVWDFELPKTPALKSELGLTENPGKFGAIELLKHRIDLDLPTPIQPLEGSFIDNWGKQMGRLPFFSGADAGTNKIDPAPSVETIRRTIVRRDPRLELYGRFIDEIDAYPNLIPMVKQWSTNFHQAGASVIAAMAPTEALLDDGQGKGRSAIDSWVVLPKYYAKKSNLIQRAKNKGDEIWFYTALAQDEYSPKWLIDVNPINYRIGQGFISQSLGVTGLLYWRVDDWTSDPWKNLSQPYPDGQFYPGEGILTYPGKAIGVQGVVPSIRLKWIRDGVDDYDYIQLLSTLQGRDQTLAISRKAGSDWYNWTQNLSLLESTRWEMGNAIERLTIEKRNGKRTAT